MAKIDEYIRELLLENECVIVPGMGGILNPHSNNSAGSFRLSPGPDLDKLSFNAFLDFNDGVLANHIVNHENLTYDEALEEIGKFVSEFHRELNSENKFIIEHVCVLYRDAGNFIRIDPILKPGIESVLSTDEAFEKLPAAVPASKLATSNITSHVTSQVSSQIPSPVLSDMTDEIELNKRESEIPLIAPNPKEFREQATLKKSTFIILFSLLTGSMLVFSIFIYFSRNPKPKPAEVKSNTAIAKEKADIKNELSTVLPDQPSDEIRSVDGIDSAIDTTGKNAFSNTPTVEKVVVIGEHKYFIIAGSFNSFENAKRKLKELKLQGFMNAQIISQKGRPHLVSYDHLNSLADAEEKKNSLKDQHKEAWVFTQ